MASLLVGLEHLGCQAGYETRRVKEEVERGVGILNYNCATRIYTPRKERGTEKEKVAEVVIYIEPFQFIEQTSVIFSSSVFPYVKTKISNSTRVCFLFSLPLGL